MKNFAEPVQQRLINIEDKNRSNIFAWRGQFSPQLIESLLDAYCLPCSVVLDPFAGSGTVLLEAATMSLPAYGFEINPAAWIFSKLYEFANVPPTLREQTIAELRDRIEREFPVILFSEDEISPEEFIDRIIRIGQSIGDKAKILCNALVVLMDVFNNRLSSVLVHIKFTALADLIRGLPYSTGMIKADLQDARSLPLQNQSIDFVVTSPPYINVFNYHQNYRQSVELLGWDLLRVARSEIGSNRANRGNRFLTVIQYCIDMAYALRELSRVLKPGGRAVFIVGYESRVLGVPFHNAELVDNIARELHIFTTVLKQQRFFTNRFGQSIREDILNFTRDNYAGEQESATTVGRKIAAAALDRALNRSTEKNRSLLMDAISQTHQTTGTQIFNSISYSEYQKHNNVMMVKERREGISQ